MSWKFPDQLSSTSVSLKSQPKILNLQRNSLPKNQKKRHLRRSKCLDFLICPSSTSLCISLKISSPKSSQNPQNQKSKKKNKPWGYVFACGICVFFFDFCVFVCWFGSPQIQLPIVLKNGALCKKKGWVLELFFGSNFRVDEGWWIGDRRWS